MTAAKHFVYEAYDAQGRPLYVGFTSMLGARIAAHLGKAPWAHRVASWTATRCDGERQARAHERERIAELRPPFNQIGNPAVDRKTPHWATRRARMAAEHAANPDCAYHWRMGCEICNDELNVVLG